MCLAAFKFCLAQNRRILLLILLSAVAPLTSFAQNANLSRIPTQEELVLLPSYCKDTIVFNPRTSEGAPPPEAKRWIRVMGRGFFSMHHYCWGINFIGRSNKHGITRQQREYYLKDAVANFNFVIEHSPHDFIMLPEVHLKKGDALARLGDDEGATKVYQLSIRAKSDYWPAYVGLADLLRNRGKNDDAKAVVEEGLRHSPLSKTLNAMLKQLAKADSTKSRFKQEEIEPTQEPLIKPDQSQPEDVPAAE